jgi:hypothetical protein
MVDPLREQAVDPPPRTSPAMAIGLTALNALLQVMTAVMMDWADTPDLRDRFTRESAQQRSKEALDSVVSEGRRWLAEGALSTSSAPLLYRGEAFATTTVSSWNAKSNFVTVTPLCHGFRWCTATFGCWLDDLRAPVTSRRLRADRPVHIVVESGRRREPVRFPGHPL